MTARRRERQMLAYEILGPEGPTEDEVLEAAYRQR